jgi:hypothetical protein
MLPSCSGKQLALLLSSAAQLRWFGQPATPRRRSGSRRQRYRGAQAVPRYASAFLLQLLLQLRRHLRRLPPTSLGLAGVAVSQLGLAMHPRLWCQPYIAQVTAVVSAATRMPAPQAADLQRSIQFLVWMQRSRQQQQPAAARPGRGGSRIGCRWTWRGSERPSSGGGRRRTGRVAAAGASRPRSGSSGAKVGTRAAVQRTEARRRRRLRLTW